MKVPKEVQPRRLQKFYRRRRLARIVSRVLLTLVILGLLAAVGVGGFVYYYFFQDLPDFTSIKDYRPSLITQIFARDGRLIGEFYAERRIAVPYSRLPRHLILAFVAAEDARFFEHPGVDLIGIIRAFVRNLEAGEIVQGGSTITQQVVKRIMLTSEKSFGRKIREAVLAYRIDNYLSKEQILNLYLNHIFLGHGSYGVEAAAQEYFSKHVEDLTLAESAILAGIPKAPSRYSPYLNPRRAKDRQTYVLRRMAEAGFISAKEAEAARRHPLALKAWRPEGNKECGYFNEHVRQLLEQQFGRDPVYNLGLKVYTTADADLHRVAQASIEQGVQELTKRNGYRGPLRHLQGKALTTFKERQVKYYRKYPPVRGQAVTALVASQDKRDKRRAGVPIQLGEHRGVLTGVEKDDPEKGQQSSRVGGLRPGDVIQVRLNRQDRRTRQWQASLMVAPMVQAALVSMELDTGKVRVIMGGKDFKDSPFNRALQAKRQPGSAFKPIIYAAAIDKGYRPSSVLMDEPLSLPGGRRGQLWSPHNYDHTFDGPISLATALARSRNVPTVRLMMAIGVPTTVKMAQTLGIASPIYPNYSSALGSSAVTPMELTRAYSVFPNQGNLVEPIFIERIEDRDGRMLVENRPQKSQVIDPGTAHTMVDLLCGVVQRGTGQRVMVLKRPIGGKTGTTNRTRDAWFIGFTPQLITGVWVGMDDERSLGPKETGSQAAAPIFISYMKEALKNSPVEDFPELSGAAYAQGRSSGLPKDDEETGEEDETYPEEDQASGASAPPQSSAPQLFKKDLEDD